MRNLIKKYIVVAILFGVISTTNGQTFDPVLASELQYKIDSIRSTYNIKGISASVYYPGMGTWKGVTGISHVGTPMTSEVLFGIASNTKLFTGVLLLKLAENNIIRLDDSLHQYVPTYPNIDSNITIRQLLNHTSGLADVTTVPGYPDSMLTDPNRVFTASEMMNWAGPPLFSAGTDWDYCNTNYLLSGMIAESATGQSYGQLLRDSILSPLQLDSTFLDVYETILYPVAQPWQAGTNNHSIPRTSINSAAWAAGAMYSTSSEMIQWYDALMNGQVLNANSFSELTTFVGSGNYGMGISQATVLGRPVWTHGGTIWGGYNSSMMYDPATGIIICVLINQLPAQAFQVSIQLLSSVLSSPLSIVESEMSDTSIRFFPNPTNGKVSIQFKSTQAHISVKIMDTSGKVIDRKKYEQVETIEYEFNQPKGIYLIEVTDDKDQRSLIRVLKQ